MAHFWGRIATVALLICTAQGCASWPTPEDIAPTTPFRVATRGDWSSQTRAGREAIVSLDYPAAETLLFKALETSTEFRSSDVRIDVSLGNLVRLAAIHENQGRTDDSKRVLSGVEHAVLRHELSRRRIDKHLVRTIESKSSTRRSQRKRDARIRDRRKKTRATAPYDDLIRRAGLSYDVDPALIKAVVAAESNFEPRALSRVGAQGLMQLMPATARAMGVRRPFVPRENIRGGVRYLRSLLDRFDNLDHALAAYNAGPDAVLRYGGVPPYPETKEYVARVRSHYRRYQSSANN
jgi:soluble lytic murein transglycosylase-like protein